MTKKKSVQADEPAADEVPAAPEPVPVVPEEGAEPYDGEGQPEAAPVWEGGDPGTATPPSPAYAEAATYYSDNLDDTGIGDEDEYVDGDEDTVPDDENGEAAPEPVDDDDAPATDPVVVEDAEEVEPAPEPFSPDPE